MFFFRKLFGLFFLGLLIWGLFGFFGRMGHGRYESAYQQGFIAGQQAAAAESGAVAETGGAVSSAVPSAAPGANVYFRGHGFFFPGFGLLLCLIPFFFIGLLSMAFGGRRRHRRYRHWRGGPCGARSWRHEERWEEGAEESGKEKSPDDIDDGRDGRSGKPIMRA